MITHHLVCKTSFIIYGLIAGQFFLHLGKLPECILEPLDAAVHQCLVKNGRVETVRAFLRLAKHFYGRLNIAELLIGVSFLIGSRFICEALSVPEFRVAIVTL